jgi:aminopeptidase N
MAGVFLRALGCAMLLLLLHAAAPVTAQPRFDFRETPGRLDRAVRPLHQHLSFELDPARDRFQGRSTLVLQAEQPRTDLLLHAARLVPGEARLQDGRGGVRALRVQPDEAGQTWRLLPQDGQPIPAGALTIHLSWEGPVQRAGQGLFRARDASGPMLATQLQAVFARQLFPGFDEPAFRVAYEVEIRAPAALEALSNMPVRSVHEDGAQRIHRFEPTPPMPAYLLALAVGPLEFLHGSLDTPQGTLPLRIVTMPGKSRHGGFALQATKELMPYFARRFGQPYTLPKLDQLAVPSTRFGAMEDWGLVSYTEDGLLFDPLRDSVQRAVGIHTLIAHELAHQWFGNLVTAASWEEIWLNEAFATWLATEASHHFHPQWQLPLGRRMQLDRVLALDAGDATRAMRGMPVDEQQVFQVFDGITYAKGGAVLSMLQQWLGRESFDQGLQRYMAERRLSNATAGDLWHHLGEAAGRDVRRLATAWTDQPGHPLVSVEQTCRGRGPAARSMITLSQRRFRMHDADADDGPLWPVPVQMARGDRMQVLVLTQRRQRFELPGCDGLTPWRANAAGAGFYRVRHDPAAHARLAAALPDLPAVDRLTLLSDTLALVQAGRRPFADWLALVQRVQAVPPAERAELLRAVVAGWQWFIGAADGGELGAALAEAARMQLRPELDRLGLVPHPAETVADAAARADLIGALARWGDEALLARAGMLAREDLQGRGLLPPATRRALIEAAGLGADEALHGLLLQSALQAAGSAERSLLLEALAAARDPALARRTLALTLADVLQPAEAFHLVQRVARASPHAALAYAHATAQFEPLMALVDGAGWGERESLLPGIASRMARQSDAQALLADQQRLAGESGTVNARRAVQQILLRDRWRQMQARAVLQALGGG